MQYAAATQTMAPAPIVHAQSSISLLSSREPKDQIVPSAADQHWIARALRAEALLAAYTVHREEVKSLGHHQEATRQVCMYVLSDVGVQPTSTM
jgi:hypothetical protein